MSLLRLADHPGDSDRAVSPGASRRWPRRSELADHRRRRRGGPRRARTLRRQLLDDGYGATVYAWARRLAASCDARDLSRLQQLVELAYDYQPRSTLRTSDFIRLVEQQRIADPTSSDVRVMTIHQAKGLQFDVVFLPELDGELTGQRERSSPAGRGPTRAVSRRVPAGERERAAVFSAASCRSCSTTTRAAR